MSDPLFYENNKAARKQSLKGRVSSLNPYIIGFLSLGTLLVLLVSIWGFSSSDTPDPNTLPVIQAASTQIRIEPDSPQGREIANSDSTIYQTFQSAKREPRIENLLKPDEIEIAPMDREELFAGLKPEIQVRATPATEDAAEDVVSITESPFPVAPEITDDVPSLDEAPTSTEEEKEVAQVQPKAVPGVFSNGGIEVTSSSDTQTKNPIDNEAGKTLNGVEPAAGTAMKAIEPVTPPPAEKSDGTANYFVQLASIQDPSKTEKAWNDLTQKYTSLKNASYRTQNAEIAGKGTFYRIQAGPFSKAQADQLCEAIKSQSGSCFVTAK